MPWRWPLFRVSEKYQISKKCWYLRGRLPHTLFESLIQKYQMSTKCECWYCRRWGVSLFFRIKNIRGALWDLSKSDLLLFATAKISLTKWGRYILFVKKQECPGDDLSSRQVAPQLLSALRRFTILFGMVKSGSTSLKSPRHFCFLRFLNISLALPQLYSKEGSRHRVKLGSRVWLDTSLRIIPKRLKIAT